MALGFELYTHQLVEATLVCVMYQPMFCLIITTIISGLHSFHVVLLYVSLPSIRTLPNCNQPVQSPRCREELEYSRAATASSNPRLKGEGDGAVIS